MAHNTWQCSRETLHCG